MDAASNVTFVERGGPDARTALLSLRDRARREGAPVRLLASRDQPGLHLLVIEGDLDLAPAERDGARVWRFRSAEPDDDAREAVRDDGAHGREAAG